MHTTRTSRARTRDIPRTNSRARARARTHTHTHLQLEQDGKEANVRESENMIEFFEKELIQTEDDLSRAHHEVCVGGGIIS